MTATEPAFVTIAGATGDLGGRIVQALLRRGAKVRAIIRPDSDPRQVSRLMSSGVEVVSADPADMAGMMAACAGSSCVVSALNGLADVVIDRQRLLLDAAVAAGVPRFIPSDFAADFTKSQPGQNRNFDFRRSFMEYADSAPIKVTSILNGAFMDMLGAEMPIIQPGIRRVLYWHDADQVLDFTAKDNVADYTAAAALDPDTPRILRIAGETLSVRSMAEVLTGVTGQRYRPLWVGSLRMLGMMITLAKRLAPQPGEPFPAWQGMQYMRDQFRGDVRLVPLDNARYTSIQWISVQEHLSGLARFRRQP